MVGAAARASQAGLPTSTLMLRVADLTTRLVCDDPALVVSVSDASRRFLVDPAGSSEPDAIVRVHRAPRLTPPQGPLLFDSGGTWRLHREESDFSFSFVSSALGSDPYRVARFDASFTRGTVAYNGAVVPAGASIAPLDFPLDELVMINLLAQGRGVEVHACGAIDRSGRAYVFAGQSEAGKSTIARLWDREGATVLNDDRLVLRLREGRVWVYGTPWHGDLEFASPASAPLSRIFFLAHGRENAARPITGAAAAARLFACCFPTFHDRAGVEFTLTLIGEILERVPCAELAFVPDPRVVQFVRDRT